MTGKTLMLKNVRLAFTQDLFVPKSFKGEANKPKKYRCKLLIAKDHPQLPDLKNEILRLATEEWKEKAPQVLASIKGVKQSMAFLDGDTQLYEGFAGNYSINATRREADGKPLYLRANPGTKEHPNLAEPSELYSGSFVVAQISFWTWSKDGYSMQCNLLGLQVYRPGEAFSGGAVASMDEFSNEDTTPQVVGSVEGMAAFL